MHVLALELDLRIPQAHSLKDRRQAVKPLIEGARRRFGVSVSEVGAQILGALLGGYVGDAYGARAALTVGVGSLLLAALWLFRSPVRALRRTPPPISAEAVP